MKILALVLILVPTISCAGQAADDWATATPVSVGLDAEPLERLRQDAAEGTFRNLHAILVARDGKLVMEEYFGDFNRETLQYTASVSKSVGSILFGTALDQGLVQGIDARGADVPLAEILPAHADVLTDTAKVDLLLRHVLTMSAGLEWDEQTYPYSDPRNDWIQASRHDDPVGFTLGRPVVAPPGTQFNYNGGLSIILSYLVEKNSGMSADDFAKKYLFTPLGITDYEWEHLACGLTDTDGGLHMRPYDMAKLGQMYLNGGLWRGSRVVSKEWVQKSGREHMVNENSPNYGFQWWCGDFQYADRSVFMFFASGHGGQKIYVVPDLDLVVVLTHEVFDNPMGEAHNNAILGRYVLPAADSSAEMGEPVELDATTVARYLGEYTSPQDHFTIVDRDGGLYAESVDEPPLELVPLGTTRFRGTTLGLVDVELLFDVSEEGDVWGVSARYAFTERRYRKATSE